MTINVEAMPDQWSDVRALTDAEMADVSGGILPALILGGLFLFGMLVGSEIHQRYYER